jgi:phosphonate transport system substrate-binding protein
MIMSTIALHVARFCATVFLLIGASFQAFAASGDVYTFALVPGAPPVTMHKLWSPVIERLAKETGFEFRLKIFDRMADFERVIAKGDPDFIFSSPIQLVVARQSAGYVPLVRDSKLIEVGLFVRQDSPIRSLGDIDGKTISFVGNKNVCSVYMKHQLMSYGKKLSFEPEYAGTARNVVFNVLLGKVDAGAVLSPDMQFESEDTRKQLRQVIATPKFTPHPISAHPRVPPPVREAVKKALLSIAASKDGAELLKPMRLDGLIEANYQRDYRELEDIDIRGLTNWGE